MKHSWIVLVFALAPSCAEAPPDDPSVAPRPRVAVSFYPSAWLVERLAGEAVELVEPVPPDADPAFWSPSDAALSALQQADLVILSGANFERWSDQVSLPASRLVVTSEVFRARWIEREADSHSHGGLAAHSHAGIDGHTWMDPLQLLEQAGVVRAALERLLGAAEAPALGERYATLATELRAWNDELAALAPALAERRILASHPSYDYLARRHGFEVVNFDLDPEAPLGPEEQAALGRAAAPRGTLLLWESEPLAATRASLAELGLASVVYAPGESLEPGVRAAGEDFLGVMRANLARLRAALGGS